MMLSKKNSEALENFSEKLEVEGRSLWQDARRRFMHNRAAVASSGRAGAYRAVRNHGTNALSVHLFRYGLGHDVQRAGYGIRALFRYRLLRA